MIRNRRPHGGAIFLDCNFKVGDFDAERNQLRIRQGKGRKDRFVYLGQASRKAIWKCLAGRKPAAKLQDPLFATRTGAHMDRNALGNLIGSCAERCGVEHAHPHRFRHTFAITYLRNGGDVFTLQRLLGHSTMDIVKRCLQLAQVDMAEGHRMASPVDNWRV